MKNCKQVFFIFIAIFLLYGCSNYTKVQPDLITGNVVEESAPVTNETAKKMPIKEEPKKETPRKIEREAKTQFNEYYDVGALIADLKEILNASYYNFTRDETEPSYIKSSDLNYYVLHTSGSDHMDTFEKFCSQYCGRNWDGFKFYLNMSEFNSYIPPLEKSNFSSEDRYRDYILDRTLVNYTRKEKIIEVENGKVLEYKFWFLEQDEHGNFDGNLMPYLLIYKIYCSPNITVFIRPKWERFSVRSPGKITETIVNWELEDDRVREDLLNKSNKILKACHVKKEFFDNDNFQPYFESEFRIWYWKTYYAYHFNLTNEMQPSAQKKPGSSKYILKEINVSFTNKDVYSLYDLKLKISVV
ncbi:hypothetical protein HYX06_04735 [Candidatus Woesearchaeota archaeon]|nr:hypothetical protein [Candidatus Woesearchaeota archaeon]